MIAFALPYLMRALPVLALLAALALGTWATYDTGRIHGRAAVQAKWDAETTAAAEARARELRETVTRMDALHLEVERLRARPARIRTVVETIHVQADAECRSAPESVRVLWNSADGDPDGPPAAPARVGDAAMPRVASDGR